MDIFDKSSQSKFTVDETDTLICIIENAQNINNHTEYILMVQRGPLKDDKWHIARRYRDFAVLHKSLHVSNNGLQFPPKKVIGNMQPSFIAVRQIALQKYINMVLSNPYLSLSLPVRNFLDPKNYSLNIPEQALQTVLIALRGDGHFELKVPLPNIGWRIRKQYFLVTHTEKQTNYMLSWQSYGLDKYLEDKDLQIAFKCLQNISHPYIDQILCIHSLRNGAYIVRKIHQGGSVRDLLYGTDYSKPYLSKYSNPIVKKPFTTEQIVHYGRQILEALKFLNEKDIPHGHVHPGNIVIENQTALLMDIENSLMGSSCLYRPYIREHSHVSSVEDIDVYCYGRTIYEMAFAAPLEETYCNMLPVDTDYLLEIMLRQCLSKIYCKQDGMPSLDHLMNHPFFTRAHGISNHEDSKSHLKIPIPLRDHLKEAVISIEARLKRDQKTVRKEKRENRIQEIINVHEEFRKNKRRVMKRESVWKSTSSLAETVRSHGSTMSSPTPPTLPDTSRNSTAMSTTPASPQDGRSALLSAICSFNKDKLSRVNSQ